VNKRIQELIKQADTYAHNRLAEIGGSYLEYYNEKFAELIVKECVSVGRTAFLNDNSKLPVFPTKQIKHHFGIEE
jgi:hypothetical protein